MIVLGTLRKISLKRINFKLSHGWKNNNSCDSAKGTTVGYLQWWSRLGTDSERKWLRVAPMLLLLPCVLSKKTYS